MGDEIFIIRVSGNYHGKRRWFVDQNWAEQLYSEWCDIAKPGQVVELIKMSMDHLIDHALDELLDGQYTDETDREILERHVAQVAQ